jgi:hypothetical protein
MEEETTNSYYEMTVETFRPLDGDDDGSGNLLDLYDTNLHTGV